MKFLILVMVCVLTQAMPVNAQQLNTIAVISGGDTVAEEGVKMTIPDVTGMTEADALVALGAVVLPDGSTIEVIKTYEYSAETAADVVCFQTVSGEVTAEEAAQVSLVVSLGEEPDELLSEATKSTEASSPLTGLSGTTYMADSDANTTASRFGIDWNSLPGVYEWPTDNSENCWYWGTWYDANGDGQVECYKTPEGTYDNNVRNWIQVHCQDGNVYLHIKIATVYEAKFNGHDYQFYIDGEMAAFQINYVGGDLITTDSINDLTAGTYPVEVRHRESDWSYTVVPTAEAYLTRYDNNLNLELEVKIPLSEMQVQNDNVAGQNVGEVKFFTPNLMHNPATAAGASTFPLATAGAALLLVPGSTLLFKKRFGKKDEKESNEQSI